MHRHFVQAEQLRGAPAAFAGDQFKMVAALAHDERLDDALLLDRIGQFLQRFGGEFLARLKRARADALRGQCAAPVRVVRTTGAAAESRGAGAGFTGAEAPPNKAPSPRPKAGLAMRGR